MPSAIYSPKRNIFKAGFSLTEDKWQKQDNSAVPLRKFQIFKLMSDGQH